MIQSLYTAASGMSGQQKKLDIIANNLANINTAGYKQSRADFKDAIYQAMVSGSAEANANNLQQGHGVILSGTTKDFSGASLQETGRKLDFSIVGEGFFAVAQGGNTYFTRNGSFHISQEGDEQYLVTASGEYVLDNEMNRISINGYGEDLYLDDKGELRMGDGSSIQLGIFTFMNKAGLIELGENRYGVSESSGAPVMVDNPGLKQNFLESSNVDLADQFSQLISAQRAFQAASRALTTADEMEGIANNIRR